MGRKPTQQLDASNSLPLLYGCEAGTLKPIGVQDENLREALDMVLTDVKSGRMTTEEFRLKIDTDLFQIKMGSYQVVLGDDHESSDKDPSDSGEQIEVESYLVVVDDDYELADTDSSDCGEQIEPPRLTTCVHISYFSFICHKALVLIEALALIIRSLYGTSRNLTYIGRSPDLRWKRAILPLLPLLLLSQPASGSMVYLGEPVTLKEGDTGAIQFNDVPTTTDQSCDYVFATIRLEGFNHPFYVDGSIDPEGLVTPNQGERFSVVLTREGCSLEIEFIITSVRIEDEGMYVVEKIGIGTSLNSVVIKRQIIVYIPPGPTTCFFTKSEYSHTLHEVHCYTVPGNGNATLTCFQDGEKIPYQGEEAVVDRRIFWLMGNTPLSCCSHDLKESESITEQSCGQFKWPPITNKTTSDAPPITKKTTYEAHPTLLNFPITERFDIEYKESETTRSGCTHARSKFWHSVIPLALTLMGCIPGY